MFYYLERKVFVMSVYTNFVSDLEKNRKVLRKHFSWEVTSKGEIVGVDKDARGVSVNPITALAYLNEGSLYRNTVKDTQKAGTNIGLNYDQSRVILDAVRGVHNRGYWQVLRGQLVNALLSS